MARGIETHTKKKRVPEPSQWEGKTQRARKRLHSAGKDNGKWGRESRDKGMWKKRLRKKKIIVTKDRKC